MIHLKNKKVKEDIELVSQEEASNIPSPDDPEAFGITTLLTGLINSYWDISEQLKTIQASTESEEINKVLSELSDRSHEDIGSVQGLIKILNPSAENIDNGEDRTNSIVNEE